jgi:hypothetical protein
MVVDAPEVRTEHSLFVTVANSPRPLLLSFAGVVVTSSIAYALVEDATFINAVYCPWLRRRRSATATSHPTARLARSLPPC